MLKRFGIKKYTIEDLQEYKNVDVNELRNNFSILIIDDEDDIKDDCESLNNLGFKVTRARDIDGIEFVIPFNIVVCDIQEVGVKFNKKYGGAYIIAQVKTKFPEKILIGYTGKMSDASFNKYFEKCDVLLTKDSFVDDMANLFDSFFQKMNNPHWIWLRYRKDLVKNEISTGIILDIEDRYVRSIIKKNNYFTSEYINKFSDPIKNILLNLASSFIFKTLTGVQ